MAKKLAKLQPKTKPVTQEEDAPQEENQETMTANELREYTDEELQALIEEGQEKFKEVYGEEPWVPRFIITPELEIALLSRNKANRFPDPKIIKKYQNQWLTNMVDENGHPIKGTMQWQREMPAIISMSDTGNLHNSQKCIRSVRGARKFLHDNANDVRLKKEGVKDHAALTGITEDDLYLVGILKPIPESAADYEDTAQQRTNKDLGYRRRLFAGMDFSSLRPESVEEKKWDERLLSYYDKLARFHNTTLDFLARRFWDEGCLPRDKPTYGGFTKDGFVSAVKEFPHAADSVFYVWKLAQPKAGKAAIAKLKVSIPYLAMTHYLASMHDAVWNAKKKEWVQTEEGRQYADAFIYDLIGLDPKSADQYPLFKEWRTWVSGLTDKGKDTLNNVFQSLLHMWRHYRYDEKKVFVAVKNGTLPYPVAGETGDKNEHDKMPVEKEPTQAEIDRQTAAKQAVKEAPAKEEPAKPSVPKRPGKPSKV